MSWRGIRVRRMWKTVSGIVAGGGRGSSVGVGGNGMGQLASVLGVRWRRRRGWECVTVIVRRRIDRIQTGPLLGGRVRISHP